MALFNGWPWANFQEQNLDWIIKELQKHADSIENLQKFVDDISGQIEIDVTEIMNEWLSDGTIEGLLDPKITDRAYMGGALVTFAAAHTTIANGSVVATAGYSSALDGGAGIYIVNSSAGISLSGKYYYPVYAYNAKALGITPDGATDNAAQLSDALVMARKIEFNAGDTVSLSRSVTMQSNRKIDGGGCVFQVFNANTFTNGQAMLTGSGLSNIEICNINFNRYTGTKHFYAISLLTCDRVRIHDCDFNSGKGYMIRLNANTNGIVRDITASNIEGVSGDPGGVVYQQGGRDMIYDNIACTDLTDHVLYMDGATELYNLSISNIRCHDNKHSNLTAAGVIAIYGSVHDFIVDKVIATNVKNGITVLARNQVLPSFGEICNCIFNKMEENAIEIHGDNSLSQTPATYIKVHDNLINTAGQDGISVRNCRFIHINNNTLRSVTRYGIESSAGDYLYICGNVIINTSGTAIILGSIAATTYCRVFNNIIQNAGSAVRTSYAGSINNRIAHNLETTISNPQAYLAGNFTDLYNWTTTT